MDAVISNVYLVISPRIILFSNCFSKKQKHVKWPTARCLLFMASYHQMKNAISHLALVSPFLYYCVFKVLTLLVLLLLFYFLIGSLEVHILSARLEIWFQVSLKTILVHMSFLKTRQKNFLYHFFKKYNFSADRRTGFLLWLTINL